MVKKILCYAIESDLEFKKYEGTWFDISAVNFVVTDDADVWGIDTDGTHRLLARYRKKVFDTHDTDTALRNFRDAATMSKTRGAAAGTIDPSGALLSRMNIIDISGHKAAWIKSDGKVSHMKINNPVASGTIGYMEKTGTFSLPCRLTTYTRDNMEMFNDTIPFITRIDAMFKQLIPDAYALQYAAAHKQPEFVIGDTAFSTITANWNFRTALHKDSGDFERGFGNLTVIEYGKYHGGVTMLPRFRIGFDVRTGDFLAMNVHEYHTNSPIYTTEEDDAYNSTLPHPELTYTARNTVGGTERYGRLALICYLREKLKHCDANATQKFYKSINFNG